MEHAQCAGTFDAISGVVDWQFAPKWDVYLGVMSTTDNGGLANGFSAPRPRYHGRIALPLLTLEAATISNFGGDHLPLQSRVKAILALWIGTVRIYEYGLGTMRFPEVKETWARGL